MSGHPDNTFALLTVCKQSQFGGNSSKFSAQMSTVAAGVNNLTLDCTVTHSNSHCLAFPTSMKALKSWPYSAWLHNTTLQGTTPTGNVPEASELGMPRYHYKGQILTLMVSTIEEFHCTVVLNHTRLQSCLARGNNITPITSNVKWYPKYAHGQRTSVAPQRGGWVYSRVQKDMPTSHHR